MRKAKNNPGMSWMWLAAGVAGAYVLYTVLAKKPSVISASEEQLEGIAAAILADASHPAHAAMMRLKSELDALRGQGAAQDLIDAKARELLLLAQQYLPAEETAAPSGAAGFAEGGGVAPTLPAPSTEIPPAPEGGAVGAGGPSVTMPVPESTPTPTTPPPAATGPGKGGVTFKPSPQSAPSRPSTGNWVTQANLYVPDTILGVVREVRKAQKTAKQMENLARGLALPKPDAVAPFVVRAAALSSEQRARIANVLSALMQAEKNEAERKQIDSRLRLLAAAELLALRQSAGQEPRIDLGKMLFLYDNENKSLKYDPVKLLGSAGTSQARPGSSKTATLSFSVR